MFSQAMCQEWLCLEPLDGRLTLGGVGKLPFRRGCPPVVIGLKSVLSLQTMTELIDEAIDRGLRSRGMILAAHDQAPAGDHRGQRGETPGRLMGPLVGDHHFDPIKMRVVAREATELLGREVFERRS
jgi:hypothetical protein